MNFYEVLGVPRDADEATVRQAYRRLARRYHPDVNDHPAASDQFTVLTRARDVLADDEERAAYDRLGHDAYVDKRIDGDFPAPDMDAAPDPDVDAGTDRGVAGTRGSSATDDASGPGSAADGATGGQQTTGGGPRPSETGAAPSSRGTEAGPDGGSSAGDGPDPSTTTSVPPTPGARDSKQATTGRGSGGDGASGSRRKPRGPRRISEDRTPSAARRRRSAAGRATGHLTVSLRWVAVLVVAVAYGTGLAGYLRAGRAGVDRFVAALTSGDPTAVAAAMGGARYGVVDVHTFTAEAGFLDGPAPSAGILLLVGALLLPATVAGAVSGLRSETTWRPSWLHVLGVLGPAAALGLATLAGGGTDAGPATTVPLVVDLLLLVVAPGLALGSFFLNRLVLVLPLRLREDAPGA